MLYSFGFSVGYSELQYFRLPFASTNKMNEDAMPGLACFRLLIKMLFVLPSALYVAVSVKKYVPIITIRVHTLNVMQIACAVVWVFLGLG